MGLILMKLLEFCQEVIILKCKNFLTHPSVPLCTVGYETSYRGPFGWQWEKF